MSSMSFMGIILFLLSGGDVIKHPPRDLVSLVDMQHALQMLKVEDSETALLVLLQEQPKALPIPSAVELEKATRDIASADAATRQQAAATFRAAGIDALPYLDNVTSNNADVTRFVEETRMMIEMKKETLAQEVASGELAKQVFAIRRLEQLKAKTALPTMEKLKAGGDPMLVEMAREAIEHIEGRTLGRPDAHELLQQLSGRIGIPVGAAAMADLVTDAKDQSLRQMFDALPDQLKVRMPTSNLAPFERRLVEFIGNVGNMRIDAICMTTPPDLGADGGPSDFQVWIAKGFWDKERLEAAWKKQSPEMRAVFGANGVTALENRQTTLCVLDNNTLVLIFRFSAAAHPPFENIIGGLAEPRELKGQPQGPIGRACELMTAGNRLALAVAFSEAQRAEIVDEIGLAIARRKDNPRIRKYWDGSFFQMSTEAMRAGMLTGAVSLDNRIELVAEQAPEPGKLAGHVVSFQRGYIEFMKIQMAGAPPEMRSIFKLGPDLISTHIEEDRVVVSLHGDALKAVVGIFASIRYFIPVR